ncbi:MAG: hypothetical protein AVDCRST_MAG86-224 [uncultured Truepera sp.]|uniref:Uncharacterized protein n=1 Tax=uncultured Truepera sp. TaxID=543023 RepID=A0A6J4UU08_9DEIN|nr:MAG: hypothetical protein AVDCRST_MAG86-224 [uncultured Truepera sp.]
MNRFCSLVLTAAALLFMSACSTPEDLAAPTLEPQFGTVNDDIGVDVATSPTGYIYELSTESQPDPYYDAVITTHLRRYDSSGKVLWDREVLTSYAQNKNDHLIPHAVYTDKVGNAYVWISDAYSYYDEEEGYATRRYSQMYKYNAAGELVDQTPLTPHCLGSCSVDVAVDGNGFAYVARSGYMYDFGSEDYYDTVYESVVGTGRSERPSTVGTLKGITVSSSGSVYVVGTKGIARYTNGNLAWTKPGNFEDVIVSGSNLYTRYRREIRKWDGTGKQLWMRMQGGLDTMVFQDMDGDGSGNVYLSGKYDADTSDTRNMDAMVRKLSPSGSVLWTKTYGTPKYDDARGIATLSGSEIYVTGETQGSLAHTNRGGPEQRDGYLRKLSSSGNPVWTR